MAPAPAPMPTRWRCDKFMSSVPWHGKGVADCLMSWALDHARSCKAPEIYLTVFDHNNRAKRFYSRYSFSEVGHCTFTLGDRVDDDRVWRKHSESAPTSPLFACWITLCRISPKRCKHPLVLVGPLSHFLRCISHTGPNSNAVLPMRHVLQTHHTTGLVRKPEISYWKHDICASWIFVTV